MADGKKGINWGGIVKAVAAVVVVATAAAIGAPLLAAACIGVCAAIGITITANGSTQTENSEPEVPEAIIGANTGLEVGADSASASDSDFLDMINPEDILSEDFLSTLTTEQLELVKESCKGILDLLTEEQKNSLKAGKSFFELNLDNNQQSKLNRLSENIIGILTDEQQNDLMFLGGGMLQGIELEQKLAILNHLKANNEIKFDDLVRIGVYKKDDLAEGGWKRFWQNLDIGGPARLADLLEGEYRATRFGTCFALMDAEMRKQKEAEMASLFVMSIAPIVDRIAYGSSVDNLPNFASTSKLEDHYRKHNSEFYRTYENSEQYLEGARDVMKNGYKVQYQYQGGIRTGYVRFMENSSKGVAKFEFVGTNSSGKITTYHVESGSSFWKMLNESNINVINPIN